VIQIIIDLNYLKIEVFKYLLIIKKNQITDLSPPLEEGEATETYRGQMTCAYRGMGQWRKNYTQLLKIIFYNENRLVHILTPLHMAPEGTLHALESDDHFFTIYFSYYKSIEFQNQIKF